MEDYLDGELNPYYIVEEPKDPYIKQLYWDMAIGLQAVDNLKPSKYLRQLSKENIEGKLKVHEVEDLLKKYYETQDLGNKKVSNEMECDLVSTRIVDLLKDQSFSMRPIYIADIHENLFKGIYDFAGIYRTYNITKDEPILNGDTVIYSTYEKIERTLEYDFKIEKSFDYSKLSKEDMIKRYTEFTSSIWQVHPFGEGNTRTIAVFIAKYLNSVGYRINNDLFKEHSVYFRNALIRSNYSNRDKHIVPTNEYLIKFFENLLQNKNNELNSKELVAVELFKNEKE